LLFALASQAQEGKQQPKVQDTTIEGLNLYPNPVSNGKYISHQRMEATRKLAFLMF